VNTRTRKEKRYVWFRGNGSLNHFGHCLFVVWPEGVAGFKETADDLRQSVEPEINMIQQEMKMVEQDLESSMKEAKESIKGAGDAATGGKGESKSV
jgi:hypothetical protein